MAYGPLSVGSDDAFSLITDQTLTKQDVAADAKAAGDAIAKKFDKAGGTIEGNIKFPDIGDTATSKKLIWAGSLTERKFIIRPLQRTRAASSSTFWMMQTVFSALLSMASSRAISALAMAVFTEM